MKQSGYRPSHRNRWLLVETGLLNLQEFCLLELYIDWMDFDQNHDTYGCFETDFNKAASLLGYTSVNSIRENKHKKLLDLGLIQITDTPGLFRITNSERYISPNRIGNLSGKAHKFAEQERTQSFELTLQNFGVKPQYIEELHQKNESKIAVSPKYNAREALGSFKGDSNVYLTSYSKDEWEAERLKDPALPSYEDKQLIDELLKK